MPIQTVVMKKNFGYTMNDLIVSTFSVVASHLFILNNIIRETIEAFERHGYPALLGTLIGILLFQIAGNIMFLTFVIRLLKSFCFKKAVTNRNFIYTEKVLKFSFNLSLLFALYSYINTDVITALIALCKNAIFFTVLIQTFSDS